SEFLAGHAIKLEVLSGNVSRQLVIAGKAVTTNTSKVSTILGRFRPDIQGLFNELGSYKNVGLGEVKGGINMLNKPDQYYEVATWWNAYNKPWLDAAIQRGDDIYLATIPQKAEQLLDASGNLSGAYAQELDYLATKKYKPINVTDEEWGNILFWLKKPYIKDGARLEIATVENAFKTHVKVVEKVSGAGVSGGHNMIEFKKTALPGQRVLITSEKPLTGVPGVTTYKYLIYAQDAKLNTLKTFIQKDGQDLYFIKTVYDPAIISDATMIDLGAKAFKNAMDTNGFTIGNRMFTGTANGRTIVGYFEVVNGERIPRTWWIEN
ncbi:MAG TPA: CdiA family toxin C-terminal domain-containing protein, partial [Bacteroidia bacterium]|nr:CdiA family toxin C-terminal domain-containing protein [Bacteroidia bacterium]